LSLNARGTPVGVDVTQDGYRAAPMVGLSVGELIEGTATLTTEQASDVIKALQDAIDVVEDAP
jgi:hypothetical protein